MTTPCAGHLLSCPICTAFRGCNDLFCGREPTQLKVAFHALSTLRSTYVDIFWCLVERRCVEFEASSSTIQDTTEVFKNFMLSVNSSIKNVNNTMFKYDEELKDVKNSGDVSEKRRNSRTNDYDPLTESSGNEHLTEIAKKGEIKHFINVFLLSQ
ncbi:hypothetical protein Glove_225g24 [Diversispora epigaea]|uniref:Uncharacterized protein n=1 Tax=Diversispora epigaea TaxID=1348612 RepID=A0A397IKW8_9GLOM|nr:hypothetical protein Glove_225g24 [Diversispora epigaea]